MKAKDVVVLVGVNIIYAASYIFSKFAAGQEFMSVGYLLNILAVIAILGIYAILWQQILKRTPISDAYMFKGAAIIFVMIFSSLFFKETITVSNIIGSLIIITGIALYAKL